MGDRRQGKAKKQRAAWGSRRRRRWGRSPALASRSPGAPSGGGGSGEGAGENPAALNSLGAALISKRQGEQRETLAARLFSAKPRREKAQRCENGKSKRAQHARSKPRGRGAKKGGFAAFAPGAGAAHPRSPEGGKAGGAGDPREEPPPAGVAQGQPKRSEGRPQQNG